MGHITKHLLFNLSVSNPVKTPPIKDPISYMPSIKYGILAINEDYSSNPITFKKVGNQYKNP